MFERAKVLIAVGSLSVIVGACSTERGDPTATSGEAITTAHQLTGAGMPDGAFALTFDDGPGDRTEELANWLGDRGIRAVFFMNGRNAPGHDAALRAVVARGHLLANHTQNHVDMTTQSGADLYHAVADTDAIIARVQPRGPWLLRAPFGAWNDRVAETLAGTDQGKYAGSVFWDVGGELTDTHAADWDCWAHDLAVDDCAQRYMNEMRDRGRGIVLMHDIHSRTIDMVEEIVTAMQGSARFVSALTAPQIVAALGDVADGNDRGEDGPSGPPPGCGSVTYYGSCEKNVLTWCNESGVLTTADCAAKGKVCSLVSSSEGHDCVDPAPCGDVDYGGACDGSVLTWCDESGALRSSDCASKGERCAFVDADTGSNCVP